jgi:hypothetical protein
MFKLIKQLRTEPQRPLVVKTSDKTSNHDTRIKLTSYNEPYFKDMAVLLCYFNPCHYNRIIQNALTVKHLFDNAKIPYFIGEIKYDNDDSYLFYPSDNIFQYSSNSYIFYKENLITTMEKQGTVIG